jgi:hypothetical protein
LPPTWTAIGTLLAMFSQPTLIRRRVLHATGWRPPHLRQARAGFSEIRSIGSEKSMIDRAPDDRRRHGLPQPSLGQR